MANKKQYCTVCKGQLNCTHSVPIKNDKHPLTYGRESSWECIECGAYYKLYRPYSELIKVVKRGT